jgi:hypothetical protein
MLVSSEPWVGELGVNKVDTVSRPVELTLVEGGLRAEPSLLMFNIEQARQHFEELTGEQVENPCL